MDPGWYLAGKILVLGRLIGHNPTPEERAEERDLCARLSRREHLGREELDICLPATAWAWIGAFMACIAATALSGFLIDDVFGVTGYPQNVVMFGFLLSCGISVALGLIGYFRSNMLIYSDEDYDAPRFVAKAAEKLYYPRAYDFWIALAASIWPALRGANLVP
ncbi:hypothetical protein H9Y04_44380 [Streptomyces sp. TRM66268-LWL]|uniref:Uncharacterized protein n=1 Tax=Streptomyces polyasparticus TaxID=2767826 RepID=A0ABR7SVN2_9ACTN|nr:hypothetical protein [Streptomyces polyasparticus]MBC9719551.1 hypothetical protein [Streptomyces polyasparticus]